MFVCKANRLPEDPRYPTDLTELGYKINDKGQFVSTSDPNAFYTFHRNSNKRVNEVAKDSMHVAVRKVIKAELAEMGVKEIYLTGENGEEIKVRKPEGQHVEILTTEPRVLKEKKDVLVVIGEHTQVCHILSTHRHSLKLKLICPTHRRRTRASGPGAA